MSKKDKMVGVKASNPLKVMLPVLIVLVLLVVTCSIIVIVDQPAKSAKVENPNKTFVKVGDLEVTNQEMYEALRSSGGISSLTFIVDSILLANQEVSQEVLEETKYDAIYGSEIKAMEESLEDLKEELAKITNEAKKADKEEEIADLEADIAEAKESAERLFAFNIKALGYTTEKQIADYFAVLAKRNAYAKNKYIEYIGKNDFSEDDYIAAYESLNPELYQNTAHVISIVFNTSDQAKNYLEALNNPVIKTDLANGWKALNDQERIDQIDKEVKELEAKIAAEQAKHDAAAEADKAAIKETIDSLEAQVHALKAETDGLKGKAAMTDAEIALAFIELYNYVNAYFQGGNVASFFDENGKLKAEYELLKKDVHYTVTTEEVTENLVTKTVTKVEFNHEKLVELQEENENCKFVFTEAEAKSTLSNAVFNDLVANADKEADTTKRNYTNSPVQAGSKLYYLAYKYGSTKAVEKSLYEETADKVADLQKAYDSAAEADKAAKKAELDAKLAELNAMKAELKPELIENKYNENEKTKFLLELRQANGLKIYDRYLNASYEAAYEYLFTTTLKLEEGKYPAYEGDGGTNKELAFSFVKQDGSEVKFTANAFFKELVALYAHQATSTMVCDYVFLTNQEFNKIYDPYHKVKFDKEAFRELFRGTYADIYSDLMNGTVNSVQAYKFAFEQGIFESNGFGPDYGWENFLRDYLLVENEQELAGVLCLDDAEELFSLSKIDAAVLAQKVKEKFEAYYSVKGLNLVIYVDYNYDASPDSLTLEEGEKQLYWTEYQMSLVQELSDKLYEAAATSEKSSLEDKLKEKVTEYQNATLDHATWGKFLAAGICAKVETAADYASTGSFVQEFHDALAKMYLEIEASEGYTLGAWTDAEKAAGKYFPEVFATSYGYHRVTVLDAKERVYVDEEKNLDYTKLTLDVYKQYVEGKEFNKTFTTAITTYLEPVLNTMISSNELSVLKAELRLAFVDQNKVVFTDSNILAAYKAYENDYHAYVKKLVEEEKAE